MSTSAPNRSIPAEPPSSCRAIENLIATYAELVDDGDFAGSFERHNGQWRFAERRVRTDLVGDVSRHLRGSAADVGRDNLLPRSN